MKKKSNKIFFSLILFSIFFFIPVISYAEVIISEIMYDPLDSDVGSGGEWIEVQNTGSAAVNLTEVIFFEAETNHSISAVGAVEVPAGGFAIISRDLTSFKNYFTSFSGLLFKASFALNDGEKLAIKDNKEATVTAANSVTYTSERGAKNDGNSLQRVGSNFIAAVPTPGAENSNSVSTVNPPASPQISNNNNSESSNQTSNQSTQTTTVSSSATSFKAEPQVYANAGVDRLTLVGAEIVFNGLAYGVKKEPLEAGRYLWNFGDGVTKEGKNVLHVFKYPGEYAVTLNVSSGEYSQGDMALVSVLPPELLIGQVERGESGFVEVVNKAKYDVDISGFKIGNTENVQAAFSFPKGTVIRAGKGVKFSNGVTKMALNELSLMPLLLYVNGSPVVSSPETKISTFIAAPKIQPLASASSKQAVSVKPANLSVGAQVSGFATQNKKEAVNIKEENHNQKASASATPFILGLVALIGISSGAVVFVRRSRDPADEYEIVE